MAHFKWLFIALLFLIFSFGGYGQDTVAQDSVIYTMMDTVEAKRLLKEAKALISARDVEKAFPLLEKSKIIYSSLYTNNSLEVADVIYEFARYSYYGQNYDEAIVELNKCLAIKEEILDSPHPDIASLYSFIGLSNELRGHYDEAIKYHNISRQQRIELYGENHIDVADDYQNLGNTYLALGKYNTAIENYNKALTTRILLFGEDHAHVPQTYLNLGITYNYKKDYKRAQQNIEKAITLYKKLLGNANHPFIAGLYNNVGLSYMAKQEYEKAIEYYQKSILMYAKLGEGKYHESSSPYANIGAAYGRKNETEKAIKNTEKALQIRRQAFGNEHPEVANALNNLSLYHSAKGDQVRALELLDSSLIIYEKVYGLDHPNIPGMYSNIGSTYLVMDKLDKAEEFLIKSLKYSENLNFPQNPDVAKTYSNITALKLKQNKLIEADSICDLALKSLNFSDIEHLSEASLLHSVWGFLKLKSAINLELYNHSKVDKMVYDSRYNFEEALSVLDYYSKGIHPSEKNRISSDFKSTYELGVQVYLLLHQDTDSLHFLTEAFSFAERSKAFLLYEAMQESEALKIAGIPDSLLEREYDLRIDIAYYDKKREEKTSAGLSETETVVLEISGVLFDLNREYESLKQNFETNYPQYFNAKYDLSTISLNEVQTDLLQTDQTLLEYMVGDSSIFIFLVQKDNFEIHEVKHDFPLDDWVREMTKDGIYGYYSIPQNKRNPALEESTISNYTNAAQQLYNKLIAPVADKLTEDLIIIPDGVLGYVPFEALLTSAPPREGAFRAYPFLLKKHQISYCYSATLLQEMRQKQHRKKPSKQLLAMAPFFQNDVDELIAKIDTTDLLASVSLRDSLGALQGSGEEIGRINKLWKGTSVYGTEASLAAFQQKAADYQILHLSTHGKADDRVGDYAYLAFGVPGVKGTFDKLYARDLYNYSLNADMVVLSACETGIGKLQKGEGIVSLARAFAYAGAKSIFNTLWKVDDIKTKDLMVYFYKNLKKGETKDEALRNAKLKYLQGTKNNGEALHPFFWAGMIGIGDMSAISSDD
ncbi:MAG: CHAT domain-containing protein/Tfp pilus assembly protein PilF [Saprospiraceae bacterium]|jgi:CHAT domain-containing protein/Tfp pilus assembly protein PilF